MIRLGSPSLAEQFSALASPHPQPIFYGLPIAPPQEVARQATALARHGTIFLVIPVKSINPLLHGVPNSSVSLFVNALPSRFQIVRHVTFLGYSGQIPVAVYVFRDAASGR